METLAIIIFKYILKELIPQFLLYLLVLCSVVVMTQLVQLTHIILFSFGLSLENIVLPFVYLLLPFLPLMIPIAFFFAVMTSFARLHSDGEVVALFAAGVSLKDLIKPVMCVAAVLCVIGMFSGHFLESWGRRELYLFLHNKSKKELDHLIKSKIQTGVFNDDFINFTLFAKKISSDHTQYEQVVFSPNGDGSNIENSDFLVAPNAQIVGSVAEDNLIMTFYNGTLYGTSLEAGELRISKFKELKIDLLELFSREMRSRQTQSDDNFSSFSFSEMNNYLFSTQGPEVSSSKYHRALTLWHSRWSNCFVLFLFGFLGVVFAIQPERKGRSHAYSLTVSSIMGAYLLISLGRWMAEQNFIPIFVGTWLLQAVLIGGGLLIFHQKTKLT